MPGDEVRGAVILVKTENGCQGFLPVLFLSTGSAARSFADISLTSLAHPRTDEVI